MKEHELRHDRLALRLSLIISRLFSGETLSLRTLSLEFGVSERTLQRDFHQRLAHLDLESSKDGYRLSGVVTPWRTSDTFTFLQKVGLLAYFPGLTRKTVNNLLRNELVYPCLILHPSNIKLSKNSADCFYRLIHAITNQVVISVKQTDGIYLHIEPYRMALQAAQWYLIGYSSSQLTVITLSNIESIKITEIPFQRRKEICRLTSESQFIQGLPYFEFIQYVINQTHHFS